MSRSSNQRQQQQLLAQQQQQMADNDAAAAAAEMFDMFCLATTMRQVLGLHRNICDTIGLRPAPLNEFYPKLKAKIRSWKAQALWKKFDARASHRAYSKGNACTGTRVLVIGAGPCGLRTAIEAQLLGAKVVVVEKRDRISRNNVLHLWPFVITDLRNLGAKKFYGKFCAGSIDHISIRQIQCILLKVALLLGVEVHEGVSFEGTIEPSEGCGWRAAISPEDHAVSHYEFDVLIGADGKRNTLEAFKRKEFRGKLAIAITANFINKKTEAEAKAEEISGVAFIFNQAFFKELYHTTGIDLENIVYYKDETHYFVMTAKKHSLIDKGVIMQDFADPAELLASQNVNTDKLLDYAREAAEFSTKYQMPNLEFAVNHYGKPDVAMFDFTSMFAAESSSRVIVRKNYRLLQCLVGDSLLEPFWPTGSGCARGFLSSMDAAYAIKLWNNPKNSILGVLAQRESIYRLLAQTTPENLQRDIGSYTVDPATRYPNLNRTSVNMYQVKHLIDTDDKTILEHTFMDTNALQASQADTPVRRKRRTGDTLPLSAVLLRWIKAQLHSYEFVQNLNEVSDCFTNGKVLCALINRYRPDLVDFNSVKELPAAESNELAFKILDKELKILKVMSGKDSIDLDKIDSKIWLNYLEQICEVFRGEIPHVKHPKLDVSELREKNRNNVPDFSRLLQMSSRKAKSPMRDVADLPHVTQRRSVLDEEKVKRQRKHEPGQAQLDTPRRAKKRRSAEKTTNIEERQQRLKEIEENRQDRQSKRRMQRFQQTQNFYKSLHMLQVNTLLRESDESSPFEDYSIFMYRQQAPIFNDRVKELERKLLYPDRERGISSAMPRGTDEQFSDRIKSMEQQITSRNAYGTEKKPKDLMRAIGKIDSNDWNVREIEKKIEQSKKTEIGLKGREKVPKWSKEQFVARQSKMSKPTRQDSSEEKFKEIDQTLKNLDKQLKEGSVLEVGERGKNKVASIAGQFVKKDDTSEEKMPPTQPIAKSNSKVALAFKKQAASEKCHFCKQTVYLMEKISTEGLILHRSCLKCHHCHTNLRPGGYAFDRDDPEGRFYCTQHFRLPAKAIRPVVRKPGQRKSTAHGSHAPSGLDVKTPEKPRGITESVVQLDLLDRGQTPERIEFENTDAMSDGEPSEEHIIDENEWSGRNFLQPSADSESDLSSSSDESDDDSESDIFEEANGSPIAQQTLQLATDWIGKQHYSNGNSDDSDDSFYDSSEGLADDGKDDTEGEEIKKAREMRREEVRLLPLPTNLPTDTETENQEQVVVVQAPQDGVSVQKNKEFSDSERFKRDLEISITSQTPPPSKADIEKIEQNSDRRFSADVDAISEKLYRLNNLMKLNKDIESMAKDNLVKSDILKKLSLKEKWLLDNSVSSEGNRNPTLGFPGEKIAKKVNEESEATKNDSTSIEVVKIGEDQKEDPILTKITDNSGDKASESVTNGDDDHGDGLNINSSNLIEGDNLLKSDQVQTEEKDAIKEQTAKIASEKMEIEGILDIVKLMDTSYIEQSKQPLPKPVESPKPKKKDPGQMIYDAEHKKTSSLSDALHQIEVRSFAGTMDTIKAQMVMPTVSQQATLDISKYFPNAKQEKQSSASLNKTQKTLKDVDLTKYFPQSPVPQRKASITIASAGDKLNKSKSTAATNISGPPKAPPRRQKSIAAPSSDKTFSMQEHQLDGAIDIQKAPVVIRPVTKKGGIKIVKKIVPKGTKAAKKTAAVTPVTAKKKIQDEADKILDEILQSGQEVRSPSIEYQRLFTEEKSPSEDISEKIEKILEETGIDLGLPPNPRKKLQKTKSLGEEEFKRTHDKTLSREDGDRPMGVRKILQRFESMSSIKSDDSFRLRKTNLSSTCSSLNRSKESFSSNNNLNKSKESLQSSGSLKSNSDSMSDLEKTMEYLKSEWRTEATNFLQKKRDTFYANRDEKKAEAKAEAKKKTQPEPQWKHTKYSKFFGIKEKSPEKRKSPTKSGKRKSPAKILKKSPREEIMKHRKKIESVSSRTASFEEKIKAEENRVKVTLGAKVGGSQNDLTNGLENKNITARSSGSTCIDTDNVSSQNAQSKIPISQGRKDSATHPDLNKNLTDTAQKILSRRGSSSSGLADVLKPPVVKGLRGQKGQHETKNKAENNTNDVNSLGQIGSQETLKTILNLVRNNSQSNINVEGQQNKSSDQSPRDSQKNIAEQSSRKSSLAEEPKVSESEAKPVRKRESQVDNNKVIDSVQPLNLEPSLTVDKEVKAEESEESLSKIMDELTGKEESLINNSNQQYENETIVTFSKCSSEDHSEAIQDISSSRNSFPGEEGMANLVNPSGRSRRGSQIETIGTPPIHPSRRGSQNQIPSVKAGDIISSQRNSQDLDNSTNSKSPQTQSRRGSQIEASAEQVNRKDSLSSQSPLSRRASATKDDSKRSSEASNDVDEIFNKIITELSKDEEESFNAAQELSLIAIAAVEEEEQQQHNHHEQPVQQQINDESEYIAQIHESPKQSRAQSEDSIEELFSNFTNDMLVDVEFDSNDEVVAITPRAVLVNEDNNDEEDENEKPITIEAAKLKFEPLFPRQSKLTAKSSSSSQSISPGRSVDKKKKIIEKLDPANMPPSVQDMMQLMISREDSEPRIPVAFPRRIYYDSVDETSSSSKSRTQTPDNTSTVKTKEPSTKEKHLEVVYELAWPKRKRTPSPIPESARPPIKPPALSRESSERPISRRGSENSIGESTTLIEENSNNKVLVMEKGSSLERESPKLLPSPRRISRVSSDIEQAEKRDLQSMSRRTSKSSLKDNEEIQLVGSPALLPTPRRGSRSSVDSSHNVNEGYSSRRNSALLPASPQIDSILTSDAEQIDKSEEFTTEELGQTSFSATELEKVKISTPTQSSPLNTSRESSKVRGDSNSFSIQSINRKDSNVSNSLASPSKSLRETPSESPIRKDSDSSIEKLKRSQVSLESDLHTTPRKDSNTSLKSSSVNSINKIQRQSTASPDILQTKTQNSSREESQTTSRKSSLKDEDMANILPETQKPSREASQTSTKSYLKSEQIHDIRPETRKSSGEASQITSRKSSLKEEEMANILPERQKSSREASQTSTKSSLPPESKKSSREASQTASRKSSLKDEEVANILTDTQKSSREASQSSMKSSLKDEVMVSVPHENQQSSREGSKTTTKSPPRAEGMVNIVDLLNDSSSNKSDPESSRKSNIPSLPESPQSARARFFAQNQSTSSSPRDSKERLIQNNEPSKEYRDLLRSKLESPSSRNPSQSRERSLEWDMEQLPKSPMPRRKYMALLQNDSEKEESPKRASIPPEPSQSAGSKSPPDIRIPTKRLEEWEIIEQLERERRRALIARDQNYSDHVQEESSKIEASRIPPKQENPTFNRLESLDEPHTSKLMEYIKQETLKDSIKSKDDSPKPPSRPRTPQLSKRISNNDLEKQVVELMKSQEPMSSPPAEVVVKRKPLLQKTESAEATYEDFARFTRRSTEKEPDDHEESDVYESPTASISHHRLSNYRHKSQDSASGTYSPTSSLSRSIEHIAPSRPHRNKSSTLPENRVDRDTKYLMDRSKHLRNKKRDFMDEKIAGNNPYLKKVMEAQKVQSDSESSSADDVELNSATEISTDSEFDHDEIIREAPKIFIDDTHLRKPTKVQIKQTVIAPSTGQPKYHINNRMTHTQDQPIKREPQFKPLVQVDPSLLSSNRMPLQNPRPGDYLLNKTASTEGIASKKSLELKKRYLLGEQGNGNKIQKSGSTSILDSKIRSFHSNISECQKLLNAGSMKPYLDRTKASENQLVVDKKIEITIMKTAIDEKENVFVNSKNELNKGMEYSETVNTTLVESMSKNKPSPIIETIDLISPEKTVPIIDLTEVQIPSKMLESNMEFIKNLQFNTEDGSSKDNNLVPDNKVIDLTLDSPVKSDKTVIEEVIEKPDVSKDVKEAIPDIITHIEEVNLEMKSLLDHEAEKKDSPEKTEYDIQETSIQVPNIPWATKKCTEEFDSLSSSSSSSVEDIQHFILDSTTSPDTQTGQIVPRLEVHDSSGTLMQIDSLMIIDGKYIGDPEDLKNMEIPPGMIIPDVPTQSPSPEEPITEKRKSDSPPPQKPELKFDTKNENKIDTLKNIPLILEKCEDHTRGVVKPDSLSIQMQESKGDSDNDKTPTAEGITRGSDSDAECTNQGLTETELSDWTADDAISENFIDLEFVLNSNKGTIKRNKKSKKKAPLQSTLSITHEPDPQPEPEHCGILKNLDIEEIEFMDTGSEGSCAEAYSATNTALLRNRGYVDYSGSPRNYRHNRAPTEYELKTPVNECPTLPSTVLLSQKSQSQQKPTTTTTTTPPKQSSPSQTQHTTQSLSQSLTDSTNDIDEDSLCMLTNSNGATANNTATITTTTEESEALTVVTSPMDSSSPKTQENFQLTASSSEQIGKTTSPSSNTTATPVTSSSSKGPTRKSSHEDLITHSNSKRKESEEMSYEEYVRKLQQKITQISNARDSIDVRKQNRRKSSKGEGSEANSVIEGSGSAKGLSVFEGGFSATVQPKVVLSTINVAANVSQDVHKVPVIPTLSSKLEELTKERTKQKDLIHDLVMDKLQCKKQLNAEKRLNRSRNRSMFGNNLTGSSLSPTPKMTSTNTSPYHVTSSSGGDHSGSSCKENNPLVGQKTKVSPKETKDVVQIFSEAPPRSAKQRPFSENFDPDSIDDQMCKLSKTQSFTYSSRGVNYPVKSESNGNRHNVLSTVYASPLAPSRLSRKDDAIGTTSNADKLRTEARARARLKSNQDLGLSPEEKLQLLRKRYHLDLQEASAEAAQLKSEELRARDRKMISSKSVNDIATAQLMTLQPDENSNTTTVRSDLVADFTSDPNLSLVNAMSTNNKVNRRQKDPERRKSIIQTFSSFFQKGNKKDRDIVGPVSGTEKSGTSQSSAAIVNSNSGGGDGMFSRFRISPKSKEKSKDNGSSPTTPVATTPQHQYRHHHHDQRSNSQDCIAKQKYQKISSYASSPQLFKNTDEQIPPPIPPLPLNYQRSDDESYATESREQKKQRAITKATRQAELKRLRIAQEIQREQEEIEVQLKELEARGVLIEKALRGEGQTIDNLEASNMGANDEKLLKELLEIWRNITHLKKRDEELSIRQQELQLEHRHAQLKDELNIRLSGSKLEKSSADVAAEGAILNEMLEIVAKRAALRPTSSTSSPVTTGGAIGTVGGDEVVNDGITFSGRRSSQIDESDI